jgi:hypothetical protein
LVLVTSARIGGRTGEINAATIEPPPPAAAPAPFSPFPDIPIPGVPVSDNCCLWQVEKRIDGQRTAKYDPSYGCDTGVTARGDMALKFVIQSAGLPCDQQDIIPDGSVLVAKGSVIRRADGFGHFNGQFEIVDPANQTLFTGYIETMDRVGSHHLFFQCEQCNPISHFEGWLVGRGSNLLPNHTIRTLLVARGTIPSPQNPTTAAVGSLNGTFIKCP